MNGYISDKLTFTNALHASTKYPRKLESFKVAVPFVVVEVKGYRPLINRGNL